MKKNVAAVLTLTLVIMTGLFAGAPSVASAAQGVAFQADFIEKDGKEVTKGKIYISDGKSRYETAGSNEIVVTRQDRNVIWLIFPKLSRYVEQEYIGGPRPVYIDPDMPENDNPKREFLDYEWIDSYRLRKFIVTVEYPGGQQDKYYEWYRDGFPLPVKTASLDGKTSFEYLKIKIGPVDPELFTAPKSYKQVNMEEVIAADEANNKGAKNKKK